MAVYNNSTSVGFSSSGTQRVAYNSLNFGSPLLATFGSPITYTGQAFNDYLGLQTIPGPTVIALEATGILGFLLHAHRRQGWKNKPPPGAR